MGPGPTLGPDATIWPLDIIDGTIALAAMDNEIKKAGQDLGHGRRQGGTS